MSNILVRLIKKYPDRAWNMNALLVNPNIDWNFICGLNKNQLNWKLISANPNITWEIIFANPDKPWDWYSLSCHPNITLEIVKENLNLKSHFGKKANWCWKSLSFNPNITSDIIKENIVYSVSSSGVLKSKFSSDLPLNWHLLSKNPNLTWDIVFSNLNKNWDWNLLSKHPNMTWEIIKLNHYMPWQFKYVSCNPNITPKVVYVNTDKKLKELFGETARWYYEKLFNNDNFKISDMELLSKTRDVKCTEMIYNNNITFREYYRQFKWDIKALVSNPRISFESIIDKESLIPSNYIYLSPNITYDYIIENNYKMGAFYLSQNLFEKHPFIMKKKRKCWKRIIRYFTDLY